MNSGDSPIYQFFKSVILGCILWLLMSVVLVPTLSIVCLPFLFYGLYSKAFLIGFVFMEVAFTLCLIRAIIYSVTHTQKGENDESE